MKKEKNIQTKQRVENISIQELWDHNNSVTMYNWNPRRRERLGIRNTCGEFCKINDRHKYQIKKLRESHAG